MGWREEEGIEAVRAVPPKVDWSRDDLEGAAYRGDAHACEK